jgi:transposase
MILAGTEIQVLVATKPVDFRKQADGLAAIVQQALAADPFCGAVYGKRCPDPTFRSGSVVA